MVPASPAYWGTATATGYSSQLSVLRGSEEDTMLRGIVVVCSLIVHLTTASYDEDETIYVDSDDELNKEFTKVEVIEYGRYSEVFSDEIVVHKKKEVEAHVSSSTEDLINIFEKEQRVIQMLLNFLEKLEEAKIEKINLTKIRKTITSLSKHFMKTTEKTERLL